ncbi:serine/threonine-protein kinase [Amycolatopsis sp. CA-230715]|uniref:serine/threonine-protein kinase n=1 Tax=Amycolatopsis sp. CA-230715 TaxID=2745196 RepID=UPI001C02737C|nr:serine/threonine-protein kinase [Amycolatopsis sp. CA-230715]QWF80945.1 Serine/threonine-protein kinase PknD [Amycolatopsis sp. CA-230715]
MDDGRVVADRYRLEEQLGRGGMGVVWRAFDLELGREVSLKRSLGADTGQIRREARIGAGLLHPNVVTVFDTVPDRDSHWLVTEYLAARTLEEIVEADGPLPEARARRIGAQLAAALAAMHARGIVHRDVKPGNVLVTEDDVAKLTDLGIARWTEVTRTGGAQLTGTLGYVAPEVAAGDEAEAASDVFSLGATLYAAVEGRSPWGHGEDGPFVQMRRAAEGRPLPVEHAKGFEPALAALMARRPADRPTATEAERLLGGADVPMPRRPRWRRRHAVLAGGALVVVVALAAWFVLSGPTPPKPEAGPGTLGADPAEADPCAAISANALAPYGQPFVDPEVKNFGSCVVSTKLADGTGQVQTSVDLTSALRYPTRPPTPGRMGDVERPDARDGTCVRSISLADTNRIDVATRSIEHAENAPLCAISESVLSGALPMLTTGPLPRRAQPFPPESLAHANACGLLDAAETTGVLGREARAENEFGGWGCVWEAEPRVITVQFSREWPIEQDTDVTGDRIRIGDRNAVVGPVPDDRPACAVRIVHRFYTPALPVLRGTEPNREEVAVVTVEGTAPADATELCGPARSLAGSIVPRLP